MRMKYDETDAIDDDCSVDLNNEMFGLLLLISTASKPNVSNLDSIVCIQFLILLL